MPADPVVSKAATKRAVQGAVFTALLTAILILGSGRLDWIAGWAYIVVISLAPAITTRMLARKHPDLLMERAKLQRDTKPWDKVLAPLIAIVLPMAMWIVAAIDKRCGWSHLGAAWQAAGFVVMVAGIVLVYRAMSANRFFASTVRIQKDRGQTVVSAGPYACVRHPGYLGMLANMLATPVALGAVYAGIPAGLCAVVLVLRTALEDRVLRAELNGYEEYARRVRGRLIPAVW
jgi:protein-S-isoprenylcysteine O-methyltransferase Ste14